MFHATQNGVFAQRLIINGYIQKWISKRKNPRSSQKTDKMKSQFIVKGMTCNHCKTTVENSLKSLPGIDEVIADVENATVYIEAGEMDDEQIKKTIENLGYSFGGIKK